jgi:hypothetical protein
MLTGARADAREKVCLHGDFSRATRRGLRGVLLRGALQPELATAISRIRNFCTLPVTVVGTPRRTSSTRES